MGIFTKLFSSNSGVNVESAEKIFEHLLINIDYFAKLPLCISNYTETISNYMNKLIVNHATTENIKAIAEAIEFISSKISSEAAKDIFLEIVETNKDKQLMDQIYYAGMNVADDLFNKNYAYKGVIILNHIAKNSQRESGRIAFNKLNDKISEFKEKDPLFVLDIYFDMVKSKWIDKTFEHVALFNQIWDIACNYYKVNIFTRIKFSYLNFSDKELPPEIREAIIINACRDGNELARGKDDKYQNLCEQMADAIDYLRPICLRAPNSLMQHKIYLETVVRELSEGSHADLLKLACGTSHNPLFNTNKTIDELVKTDAFYNNIFSLIGQRNSFDNKIEEILNNTQNHKTQQKLITYFEDVVFNKMISCYMWCPNDFDHLDNINDGKYICDKDPRIIAAIANVWVRLYNSSNLSSEHSYSALETAVRIINTGATKHKSLIPLRYEINILLIQEKFGIEKDEAQYKIGLIGDNNVSKAFLNSVTVVPEPEPVKSNGISVSDFKSGLNEINLH